MARGTVYIGTSGWMYKDWGKAFYPPGMKQGFLTFLAGEFPTVEVNTSFYHLPRESTFAKWKGETPPDFVFAIKLSRLITHQKKLVDTKENITEYLLRARALGRKLGPILIQLPPWLRYDPELLTHFLTDLAAAKRDSGARRARFALEPRHRSWMEESALTHIRTILRKKRIALVLAHSAKIASFAPVDENLTTDFVYVRFHGPSEFAASRYGPNRLRPWARRIEGWRDSGLSVYVYFNNDIHGHAIHDARTLTRQVQ